MLNFRKLPLTKFSLELFIHTSNSWRMDNTPLSLSL